MKTAKFKGWTQLIFVSLIVGLSSLAFREFLQISNTIMFSNQQVVMSATIYGLAFSVYALLQGPPQVLLAKVIKKVGARKVLIVGCMLATVLGLGISNLMNTAISFVVIYGLFFGFAYMLTSQLASQTIVIN
jgi:MFS family permease